MERYTIKSLCADYSQPSPPSSANQNHRNPMQCLQSPSISCRRPLPSPWMNSTYPPAQSHKRQFCSNGCCSRCKAKPKWIEGVTNRAWRWARAKSTWQRRTIARSTVASRRILGSSALRRQTLLSDLGPIWSQYPLLFIDPDVELRSDTRRHYVIRVAAFGRCQFGVLLWWLNWELDASVSASTWEHWTPGLYAEAIACIRTVSFLHWTHQ